jgi:hypothetical protein
METIKCYRFVNDDLISKNGEMSWTIGEWKKISGKIVCCSNGLHAALTPRDSLRNVYGQRWFVSEARGELVRQDNKFAASEMRIVWEIPKIVLQGFAIWCAKDCLKYFEKKYPKDKRVSDCIQAVEDYLDGKIKVDELIKKREVAAADIAGGGAAVRAVAAAIAATFATIAANSAAWANSAAASAYAAHTAAAAYDAAIATADAHAVAHNVASAAAAAVAADTAAAYAHIAAAAGAAAHAAAVAAAHNVAPPDTTADAYYSAYTAYSAYAADIYYVAQNEKLLEMIDQSFAEGTLC